MRDVTFTLTFTSYLIAPSEPLVGESCLDGSIEISYPVVGLGFADAAALGPVVLLPVGCGCQFLQLGGPEPTVDLVWEEVGSVAALEVAQTTRGPDVFYLKSRKKYKLDTYQ